MSWCYIIFFQFSKKQITSTMKNLSFLIVLMLIGSSVAGPLAAGIWWVEFCHCILIKTKNSLSCHFLFYCLLIVSYAGCAAVTVGNRRLIHKMNRDCTFNLLIFLACFSAAGFTFGTVPGAIIAATPALGIRNYENSIDPWLIVICFLRNNIYSCV